MIGNNKYFGELESLLINKIIIKESIHFKVQKYIYRRDQASYLDIKCKTNLTF